MNRFRTLRGRLTAAAVVVTAVVVAIVVLAFNVLLEKSLNADVNSRLRTQAAAAATTIYVAPGGTLRVREAPDDEAVDAKVWVFDGHRVVLEPHAPTAVQAAARALAGRGRRSYLTLGHPKVRLYALPVTPDGRHLGTVVAAHSLVAEDKTSDVALIGTIALAAVLLLVLLVMSWVTIGRALRPVAEMTRTAAHWGERAIGRRFGSEERPDELGELARTFDALLDRVSASLRHEQRLSAELSHELRTPLARILAEMELLGRRERTPQERERAYEVVVRSAEQMNRILETLLAAARAETEVAPGRSDIAAALANLREAWAPAVSDHGARLDVHMPGGPLPVGLDADIVERVLAPLLDNASRYASSIVSVDARRSNGHVEVRVHDDGPGVAPGEEEAIFAPGARGDRQVDGHRGTGLGLALSRRLARAAGGDVRVDDDGAGACFLVELPA
jgi:signal transduction histidine kinase